MSHLHDVIPLAIEGLAKSYGRVPAVEALDLTVPRGVIAGLIGPNGSGKTTTLRAVARLLEPDAGRILVDGHEHGSRAARASSAYVPDEPTGFDELTLDEFLALYAALYRAGERFRARASALVAAFGLQARARAPLASLSRGMRRQATMVAACALAPPLVLVDEAVAALDPEAVITLREALRELAHRDCGVLLATQDLHFAETTCDHVFLLSRGRLVADGSPAALRSRLGVGSLESVFLKLVGDGSRIDALRDALGAL